MATFIYPPSSGGGGSGSGSDMIEYRTLTSGEAAAKQIVLANTPLVPNQVELSTVGGTNQYYGVDFTISGNILSWSGLGLDGILSTGDELFIEYGI